MGRHRAHLGANLTPDTLGAVALAAGLGALISTGGWMIKLLMNIRSELVLVRYQIKALEKHARKVKVRLNADARDVKLALNNEAAKVKAERNRRRS